MTTPPQLDGAFIEATLAGHLRARSGPARVVTGAAMDSRAVREGDLFVALPGEHHDGHDFALEAARRGAAALLVERPVGGTEAIEGSGDAGVTTYLVDDVLASMQALGAAWRRKLLDLRVVGITGSVGKTTTRAFTAALLARRFRVQATAGSFNNEIGVPLTLLQLRPETERAVIEMGMYTTGEIAQLCDWAQPAVGVVLNVGPVHMERAGSIEAIVRAKRELIEALPAEGCAILNLDDHRVASMASHTQARVVSIGESAGVDVRAADVVGHGWDGFEFTLHFEGAARRVRVQLPGRHLVTNALAAAAVSLVEGIDLAEVAAGLEALRDSPRMRVVALANGVTLLDDTYNANPGSMAAALALLADLPGRHVAVLGDMLELGPVAAEEHRALGQRAAEVVAILFTVGQLAHETAEAATASGLPHVDHLESADRAPEVLRGVLQPGDVLLVKGSRALALEGLVRTLEREIGVAS
ncbi:MAG: UDP-N-acetylmuramoyl-tripeptide--D-alanyl-D-alanine ligase [Dehalococcoidia bacterium]|nr:UDP-N-acetylmuramoyl-tripeptide--D-alanyl-D-alanine ligase [Dehalococcoidia bacterium]